MKIISLREKPEVINDILKLHRENTKTLGFLPESAFNEALKEDRIIVAIDETNKAIGYIFFSINRVSNFIYITHLCIAKPYRKKGIAKSLFRYLRDKYNNKYRGVRVTCRNDFEATRVWEKLGFTFMNEKAGRSKYGTTLYIWWFDFNHQDLFSSIPSLKMKVILDSNIVYDLMEAESPKNLNSHALMSDWLTEDVEYFITDQLKNDISHNKSKNIREKSRQFISQFRIIENNNTSFDETCDEIKKIYNKRSLNYREEADIRHIARAANSEATYFLTKDDGIIEHSKEFWERYSLNVLKPDEFIIKFASLLNETDYNPSRLSGTTILRKVADINDLRNIPRIFYQSQKEKLKQFENSIKFVLLDNNTRAFLVLNDKEFLSFYTIFESDNSFEIAFFRYSTYLKDKTVLIQLINDIIYLAREKRKRIICINEKYIQSEIESVLVRLSFIKVKGKYFKYIDNATIYFHEIAEYLVTNILIEDLSKEYLKHLGPFLHDKKYANQIEKYLFPLKIVDSNMPCFIVPIKPKWAMNLFNVKIAEQDLFGGDSKLMFNTENVYYRSSRPFILENNSRILWYISQGNKKYNNTMNISTSSYLTNLEIGNPKILYSKNKRLGIYKWNDVYKTASNDINKDIMSFSFGFNENFVTPVAIPELEEIYQAHRGKKFFPPQTPFKISEKMFFEIYLIGMKDLINAK